MEGIVGAMRLPTQTKSSHPANAGDPVIPRLITGKLQHREHHSTERHTKEQCTPPRGHWVFPETPTITECIAVTLGATRFVERAEYPRVIDSHRLLVPNAKPALDCAEHQIIVLSTS